MIYFLLTAWQHPSGLPAVWVSPTLIMLLPSLHSAPSSALLRPLCMPGPASSSFLDVPSAGLQPAWCVTLYTGCSMQVKQKVFTFSFHALAVRQVYWATKLAVTTLLLKSRLPRQHFWDYHSSSNSLSPSCPPVPFVHEQKFFTRTCFLCSRTLFSWLHSDLALPLITAGTDTYPHVPNSAGPVKGSADSYHPLMVSPRWPLSMWFHEDEVSSLPLEMLSLPYHWFITTAMVCRLVLAVVSAQVLSCPEQQQTLVCLVSVWSGPVAVPISSSLIACFYFSWGFISTCLAS